jgi:hypothetical protein
MTDPFPALPGTYSVEDCEDLMLMGDLASQ